MGRLPKHWTLVSIVGLLGCGPYPWDRPVPVDLGESPDAIAQAEGDAQLAEDLNTVCRVVREGMRDRSVPLYLREREMVTRMQRDPETYARMDALITNLPEGADEFYGHMVDAASDRGVDFECEPLARLLRLRAAGDDDVDESLFPPIEQELATVCRLARDASAATQDPREQARYLDTHVDSDIRHWRVREQWSHAPDLPEIRYAWFSAFAREYAPSWECDALRTLWEPLEPD